MPTSERRRRAVVAFAVAIIILVAAAGGALGVDRRFLETRMSQLSWRDFTEREFYTRLEGSLKNHLPGRAVLVRSKQWIDGRLFRARPSTDVLIGLDGWLFWRDELKDFRKDSCSTRTAQEMRELARQLSIFERAIESSGRQFLFIVAPNKTTIYPEYVGLSRQRISCNKSQCDVLREAFAEFPVRNFVRLDTILLEHKGSQLLYLRTDNHWNYDGALVASRAILRHFAPSTWEGLFPSVTMERRAQIGNLAAIMDSPVIEQAPYPAEISHASGRMRLPPAVTYHDSFMVSPLQLLRGSFERLDGYEFKSHTIREALTHLTPARIVIVELVEYDMSRLKFYIRAMNAELDRDPSLLR